MKRGIVATIASALACAGAGGTAALAQNQAAEPVLGPPELRDFSLPGTKAPPPKQTTPPPARQPAPASKQAPPPVAAPVEPADLPPAARIPPPASIPLPDAALPEPLPADPGAAGVPEGEPQPGEIPLDLILPEANAMADVTVDGMEKEEEEESPLTLAIAILLGAATLIFAFLGWRRSRREESEPDVEEVLPAAAQRGPPDAGAALSGPVAGASAAAGLAPAVPAAAQPVEPRPWLEIVFSPTRAAATPSHAEVSFEFALRNIGSLPAQNVRIDARIFNASDEAAVSAFFASPDPARSSAAPQPIPPGIESHFRSNVTMPLEEVRALTVEGRSLFIPVIAINVTYEWGAGKEGQTSRSYLVGRETEPPSEKMAPFRLDLGPRVYRSVGQRQNRLAHVA